MGGTNGYSIRLAFFQFCISDGLSETTSAAATGISSVGTRTITATANGKNIDHYVFIHRQSTARKKFNTPISIAIIYREAASGIRIQFIYRLATAVTPAAARKMANYHIESPHANNVYRQVDLRHTAKRRQRDAACRLVRAYDHCCHHCRLLFHGYGSASADDQVIIRRRYF